MTYPSYTMMPSTAQAPLAYPGAPAVPLSQQLIFGAPAAAPAAGPSITPFSYQAPVTTPTSSVPAAPAPTTPAPDAETPDMSMWDGFKGLVWDPKKGFNLDGLEFLTKGIGTIGSIWGALQQNKLANEMFDFQKQTYADNYANQISSYNTALQDRADGRASQEGRGQGWANRYVEKNKI